jgi:hypothetical protein
LSASSSALARVSAASVAKWTRAVEPDAPPQAQDRIEHRARRVRKRPALPDRAGVADAAAAPEEPRAVGLVLHGAQGLSLDGRHVRDPDRLLLGPARSPRGEEGLEAGRELRLDEEIGEGGVGPVDGSRREHELGEGRDLDLARPRAEVRERDLPDLGVVL